VSTRTLEILDSRLSDIRNAIMRKELDEDVGWDLRDELLELTQVVHILVAEGLARADSVPPANAVE
jgi:hypothetical protein